MFSIIKRLQPYKDKFQDLSLYMLASLASSLVGIIVNPFLAQGLSHDDYAIIGYYASFGILLTPIVTFSLNSYFARNYYRVSEKDRVHIYYTLQSMFLCIGIVTFLLFYLTYSIYHKLYVNSIPFSPFAILAFLPQYIGSFYNLYLLKLRLQNKVKRYCITTILNNLICAFLSIFVVYIFRFGAVGRLSAILVNSFLFAIYSLLISDFKFKWDKTIVNDALKFCWPLAVSGVLSFFFLGIDRPMLERLDDNYNLGLYNVGLQISSYLAIFGTVLLQTFDPDLYKYTSTNQHKKVFITVIMIISLCAIPNFLFISISKRIIGILTANRYIESASYANILCLKNIATTFAYVISGVLIGYGYSKCELYNKIIGAIISFGIYYLLINNYSFTGAAWGQSLSFIVMGFISLICLFFMRKHECKA